MIAKAASIAACRSLFDRSAATSISTRVPSKGRARRTRVCSTLAAGDSDGIRSQNPANAVCNVFAREGGAADVLNIVADSHRIAVLSARKLRPPAGISHLAAVGLSIFQDLGLA